MFSSLATKRNIVGLALLISMAIYFIFQWQSIRNSEGYETAVKFVLEHNPQLSRDDITLVSYSRTSVPKNAENEEIIGFKFKLKDDSIIKVKATKYGQNWSSQVE